MARPGRRLTALVAALLGCAAPLAAASVSGQARCGTRCPQIAVFLEGAPRPAGARPASALLDQKDDTYLPPLLIVESGAAVTLRNSDPELHNVHAYRGNDTFFNLAIPFAGTDVVRRFDAPGTYELRCDVHPEMLAWVVVLGHPYFAVPDADGRFAIDEVPSGRYTLVRYDPTFGNRREKPADLTAGSADVSF